MGTNATIGIELGNGAILGVHCQLDGYLDHTGKLLLDNYNTTDKVLELLGYGNLRALGSSIGEASSCSEDDRFGKGWCSFTYRDAGTPIDWKFAKPRVYRTLEKFCYREYAYLFRRDISKWVVYFGNYKDGKLLTNDFIEYVVKHNLVNS